MDPENLSVALTNTDNSFTLSPLLLNSRDTIIVELLLNNYEGTFTIDSRIVGIKSITTPSETSLTSIALILIGLAISLLPFALFAPSTGDQRVELMTWQNVIILLGFIFGPKFVADGLRKNRKFRRLVLEPLRKFVRPIMTINN